MDKLSKMTDLQKFINRCYPGLFVLNEIHTVYIPYTSFKAGGKALKPSSWFKKVQTEFKYKSVQQ